MQGPRTYRFGKAGGRFNTGLQPIKAMLEAGEIGPVHYVRAFMTTRAQDPKGWRALGEQARYWALPRAREKSLGARRRGSGQEV